MSHNDLNLDQIATPLVTHEQRQRVRDIVTRLTDAADILDAIFPGDDQPRTGHLRGERARAHHMARAVKGVKP